MLVFLAAAALVPAGAGAVPAAPGTVELKQPNGRAFDAKQFGDEWYNGYESRSGYTLLRDPDSDVWRYAEPTSDGELDAEGPRATAPPPAELERHLRDDGLQERAEEKSLRGADAASAPSAPGAPALSPSPANLGNQPVLVILAEFADRNSQTNASSWRSRFFGESSSVRSYWSEASYGNLDLGPATESYGTANDGVVGWVRLSRNHPQGNETAEAETVRDAIRAADPYVNYASYDRNNNGKISGDELHVVVIPAGYEQASCGAATPYSTWGHNWSTFAATPTVDGKQVGGVGGRADGSYSMFGETHCDSSGGTWMATIGVIVHELGHDLDLPDLYSSTGGADGVGAWSVMAGGTWLRTGSQHQGETPSHPDAWSKYYEGWTTPQQRSGTRLLGTAATTPDVMRLGDNPGGVDWSFDVQSGSGEYFLVENRQRVGYDAALPGCGLIVWHIDETRTSANTANADGSRRLVDLEEADNNNSPWNAGDAFQNRSFNGGSTPNSNFYSGAGSGLGVEGMNGCGSTMGGNFLQTGQTTPDNDLLANAIDLSGRQGTRSGSTLGADKEAGEPSHAGLGAGKSIWYRWTAPRTGPVTIDTVGSGFDTVLGVYTGSRSNELSQIAANDDLAPGTRQSRVSFNAAAGTTYRVAVDGYYAANPSSGAVSLQWDQPIPPPANDNFASATTVNTLNLSISGETNEGATKESGEPNHAGNSGGGSVWYRWTAPRSGRVEIDTSGAAFDTVLAAYRGTSVSALTTVASDDDGGTGGASRVEFAVAASTTYRIAVDGYNNARGSFPLHLTFTDDPPNTAIGSKPAATTTSTDATFSFSSSGEATGFQCKLDGDPWAGCSSPKSYSGLGLGSHQFYVRAVGPGGTDGSPATHSWTIEAVPPDPPDPPDTALLSAPVDGTTATGATFSFSSSGEATGFECRLDEAAWQGCSSPHSYAGLGVGRHAFVVRAVGPGGPDPTPEAHLWRIAAPTPPPPPNVAPETTILSGPPARNKARRKFLASFTFSASEQASFSCRINEGPWSACDSPFEKKLKAPRRGRTFVFEVRATDAAGLTDATPAQHTFKLKKKKRKKSKNKKKH